MSNQSNSFSIPISDEMIRNIDKLNLTIIQKHHIRLLAHCLAIFKEISKNETTTFDEDELLRDWCVKQSQQFNDQNFNELFYKQMSSAAKKLNFFSKSIKKDFKELDIEDLITLVVQNPEN
tara:strand:+ start:168 stop:530 length:363 start_codon:yes stop_codon:yes gene_type:complete